MSLRRPVGALRVDGYGLQRMQITFNMPERLYRRRKEQQQRGYLWTSRSQRYPHM